MRPSRATHAILSPWTPCWFAMFSSIPPMISVAPAADRDEPLGAVGPPPEEVVLTPDAVEERAEVGEGRPREFPASRASGGVGRVAALGDEARRVLGADADDVDDVLLADVGVVVDREA